jgi:hypothetical protein
MQAGMRYQTLSGAAARVAPDEESRLDALRRLFERRSTIDGLIENLERYQALTRRARIIPIRASHPR